MSTFDAIPIPHPSQQESHVADAAFDPVVEAVRADLLHRSQVGIAKYGTMLDRQNLDQRAWLQHAYEEALDLANYLKRSIMELDAAEGGAEAPPPPRARERELLEANNRYLQRARDAEVTITVLKAALQRVIDRKPTSRPEDGAVFRVTLSVGDLSAISDAIKLAGAAPASERFRHVKRGTVYEVLARGVRFQGDAHEPETVVLYRGEDGTLWAQEEGEFDDGRFVRAEVSHAG